MKHFFITMICVAFLTISGCNIYFNGVINELDMKHQSQIEWVTDSINNHYMNKIDTLDKRINQIFNDNYELSATLAQQVYNRFHLINSINQARKELCLQSTKE